MIYVYLYQKLKNGEIKPTALWIKEIVVMMFRMAEVRSDLFSLSLLPFANVKYCRRKGGNREVTFG